LSPNDTGKKLNVPMGTMNKNLIKMDQKKSRFKTLSSETATGKQRKNLSKYLHRQQAPA